MESDDLLANIAADVIDLDFLDLDAAPPTTAELAAWINAGDCPDDAMDEAAARLAAMWRMPATWLKLRIAASDAGRRLRKTLNPRKHRD